MDACDENDDGRMSLKELVAAIEGNAIVLPRPADLGKEVVTVLLDGHRCLRDQSFYAGYGDNSLKRWKFNPMLGTTVCLKEYKGHTAPVTAVCLCLHGPGVVEIHEMERPPPKEPPREREHIIGSLYKAPDRGRAQPRPSHFPNPHIFEILFAGSHPDPFPP